MDLVLFAEDTEHSPKLPTEEGKVRVWDGAGWPYKPVKYWDGTAWIAKPLKRWNGISWVAA